MQYSCYSGYYDSRSGSSNAVSTCNGASYSRSMVTMQCEGCPIGSYCPGDNQRYDCPPGTYSGYQWYYWWYYGYWYQTTPMCAGYCSNGYYCPAGSVSPYQRSFGGPQVYCPWGSGAPITVPDGYLSMPEEYPNNRYYLVNCPAGRRCKGGVLLPLFAFPSSMPCGGGNASVSVTIIEGQANVLLVPNNTVATPDYPVSSPVVWSLTDNVWMANNSWYTTFLSSPYYRGNRNWGGCPLSSLNMTAIGSRSARLGVSPSAYWCCIPSRLRVGGGA